MLTKGLDNIPGTSGNDLIIGSIDAAGGNAELMTLSTLDIVNGGAGTDTLKIASSLAAATNLGLPNLTSVEIIEVEATTGVTINTSAVAGVTNLNILKQGAGLVDATAAATTDIAVTLKEDDAGVAAALANVIKGGKNVTVTATDLGGATVGTTPDTITVGGAGAQAAAGDVVVNATGAASVAATDMTLSAIAVTGGKTISVTQKATSNAAAAAADVTGATITQGAVTITGNAATTTVTVKQDASVAKVLAAVAVAGKAATQEVTFTEAQKGDTVTLDFGDGKLTFTAKKYLSAADLASAFANLATGAKQGNASATLGIYTDATDVTATGVTNKWSSGAVQTVDATKSKVVFSTTDLAAGAGAQNPTASISTAKTGTVTAPVAATAVGGVNEIKAVTGVLGVANGAVVIDDSGAGVIKTITVEGYATASTIGAATPTTVLETLNLSNAAGTASMTVADTAATLALTVEKLGAAAVLNAKTGAVTTAAVEAVLDLAAAPTTLNVKSVGNNRIDLNAVATETLNVSGTGTLTIDERGNNELNGLKTIKVTETAGLTLNRAGTHTDNVTSVDTTGTTGTVSISIKGAAATYAGGAGVDNVRVIDAGTAIAKAIDLGAGNDRLDLSKSATGTVIDALAPAVELKGGEGTADTIVLSAVAAVTATGGTSFQDKISGFEKLEVTTAATDSVISLNKLDAINYVISNGTAGAVYTGAVTAATTGETFTFLYNGVSYTATLAGVTIGDFNTAIDGAVDAAAAVLGANKVTATGAGDLTLAVDAAGNTLQGGSYDNGGVAINATNALLTFDKMLTGATVELKAAGNVAVKLTDTAALTDVVNLIANAADGVNLGVATVAGVETINITANDAITGTDVSTNTLALSANKAATVNVEGAGNLTLTLAGTSTEVTLIDASTAKGKLVVATLAGDTAATTVKGGLAADTLTAAGSNDVLQGNAGKDTLKVTTGTAVTLTGGDDIDAFDVSGFVGTAGGAATITDFAKGETIKFVSNAAADFVASKVTLVAGSTLTEYIAAAMKAASVNSTVTHGVAWFQLADNGNTNTYIVQNIAADAAFNENTDIMVMLTGTVDLSASYFNEVGQGTLLYI